MRIKGALKLEGFAGASVALQGGVDVSSKKVCGALTKIKTSYDKSKGSVPPRGGQYQKTNDSQKTYNKMKNGVDVAKWQNEEGASASVGASAFLGVSAGVNLTGSIDVYMSLEPGSSQKKASQQESSINDKWVSLAEINLGVHLQLGGGLEWGFRVSYNARNKKFEGLVKAGLCVGVGGKGNVGFVINAQQLLNFAIFVYRMKKKLNMGDMLNILVDGSYPTLARIQVVSLAKNQTLAQFNDYDDLDDEYEKVMKNGMGTTVVSGIQMQNGINKGAKTWFFLDEARDDINKILNKRRDQTPIHSAERKVIDHAIAKFESNSPQNMTSDDIYFA